MGVLDTLKGLVGGHKNQADEGVAKGGQMVDKRTGGSYTDQINTGEDKARQEIDGLDDGTTTP